MRQYTQGTAFLVLVLMVLCIVYQYQNVYLPMGISVAMKSVNNQMEYTNNTEKEIFEASDSNNTEKEILGASDTSNIEKDIRVSNDAKIIDMAEYIQQFQDVLEPWQKQVCSKDKIKSSVFSDQIYTLPVMHKDISLNESASNVYLVETSCSPNPNFRAWCSVESWAKVNPDMTVWYLISSPFLIDASKLNLLLQTHYPNLRVAKTHFNTTFNNTPMWDYYLSSYWARNTGWPEANLSDMMRSVLIWKYGGIYSDTDIICIKSGLGHLFKNAVALQTKGSINGAVMVGQKANNVIEMFIKDVMKNLRGNNWGSGGPKSITRVLNGLCNLTDTDKIIDSMDCQGMTILNKKYFYPNYWRDAGQLLWGQSKDSKFKEKLLNGSYALHFWNKVSKGDPIKKGAHSVLEDLAKEFCPVTYEIATSQSNFY